MGFMFSIRIIYSRFAIFSFFFNDTATTEIYTLSLHDALPICHFQFGADAVHAADQHRLAITDRKSTRLNSSHANISYAVFCLKKKKKNLSSNLFIKKNNKKKHTKKIKTK